MMTSPPSSAASSAIPRASSFPKTARKSRKSRASSLTRKSPRPSSHNSRPSFGFSVEVIFFHDILLRQIGWPVPGIQAHAFHHAFVHMRSLGNESPAPQVKSDGCVVFRVFLAGHKYGNHGPLWPDFSQPPPERQRIVHLCRWARRRKVRICAQHVIHFLFVQLQPGFGGLNEHPPQCNLRKTALKLWTAPSHIGMHPREPYLLQILLRGRRRQMDQVLPEEGSPFIDGHRVPHNRHIGKLRSVRQCSGFQSDGVEDPTHRTHRVPKSQEVWSARP